MVKSARALEIATAIRRGHGVSVLAGESTTIRLSAEQRASLLREVRDFAIRLSRDLRKTVHDELTTGGYTGGSTGGAHPHDIPEFEPSVGQVNEALIEKHGRKIRESLDAAAVVLRGCTWGPNLATPIRRTVRDLAKYVAPLDPQYAENVQAIADLASDSVNRYLQLAKPPSVKNRFTALVDQIGFMQTGGYVPGAVTFFAISTGDAAVRAKQYAAASKAYEMVDYSVLGSRLEVAEVRTKHAIAAHYADVFSTVQSDQVFDSLGVADNALAAWKSAGKPDGSFENFETNVRASVGIGAAQDTSRTR